MARPSRCRRICTEPLYNQFAPEGKAETEKVILTVDEFETIRLIDFDKRTHEQCAEQMAVSRTTVTEMYARARYKLADCLINGKTLHIAGGNYSLCDGSARRCCGRKCHKVKTQLNNMPIRQNRKDDKIMKIAVTYEDGAIYQHFGHTSQFKVYTVEDDQIVSAEVVDTNGQGHGALAGFLLNVQADVLICGGIGGGAQNALAEAGIKLYGGVSGDADAAVEAFVKGELDYNPNVHCSHHGEGHTCGHHHGEGHSCGEDKHGCAGK